MKKGLDPTRPIDRKNINFPALETDIRYLFTEFKIIEDKKQPDSTITYEYVSKLNEGDKQAMGTFIGRIKDLESTWIESKNAINYYSLQLNDGHKLVFRYIKQPSNPSNNQFGHIILFDSKGINIKSFNSTN